MDIPEVKEGTNEAASVEFTRVANEEDRLAQETGLLRRRLDKVEQLSMTLNDYGSDLVSQEDRLQGVGWFGEKLQDTHICPVCAAVHNDAMYGLRSSKRWQGDEDLDGLSPPSAGKTGPRTLQPCELSCARKKSCSARLGRSANT